MYIHRNILQRGFLKNQEKQSIHDWNFFLKEKLFDYLPLSLIVESTKNVRWKNAI